MLKIRLQRVGRVNDPSFRVVVTESTNATRSGRFLEIVGNYDIKKGGVEFNAERIKYWLSKGAQATGTVHNFLISQKIITGKKINVLPKKRPIKKEEVVPAATQVAVPTVEAKPAETPQAETVPAEVVPTEAKA